MAHPRGWKEWLSVLADVLQVASFLGFGFSAISLAPSLAQVLGLLPPLPWIWIALAAGILAITSRRLAGFLRARSAMVPLHEAARRAYEECRGTRIGDFVERNFSRDPDQVLSVMGHYVADTSVPLFGKHAPSRMFEIIDRRLLASMSFRAAATELAFLGRGNAPYFTELSIRNRDLPRAIREVRALAEAFPRP